MTATASVLELDELAPAADPELALLRAFLELADAEEQDAPFAAYVNRPVDFAREVLGVDPWGRYPGMPEAEASQVDILLAVRDADWVAVRSGHKIGKSNSDAIVAIWWVMTRRQGRVTLTAPANHQVESILWPEIRTLFHGARRKLPGHLYEDCRSGLKLGDGWGILGLTTNEPERMSGKSGKSQLYIVDEASGYPEDIFESIFGNLAGGGKVLLTGNPTRLSGTFHGAFHGNRSRWRTLHTSSLSVPNFHGGQIQGLATPAWHEWALGEWGGPGSPIYDVRVLGRFPTQGENAVVPLDLVEAAKARWATSEEEDDLDIGLDVAREGDDETIAAPRRGRRMLPLVPVKLDRAATALPPGPQVAEAVVRLAEQLRRPGDRHRPRIKVDAIGVGTAVLDWLVAHHAEELEIVAVNTALPGDTWLVVAPATDGAPAKTAYDEYRNLRAQIAFGVTRWLRAGGALPDDGKLEAELVAPTFSFREKGKLAVEEKREVKKRLKRSPDRADAAALAIYDPPRVDTDRWVPEIDDAQPYRFGNARGIM